MYRLCLKLYFKNARQTSIILTLLKLHHAVSFTLNTIMLVVVGYVTDLCEDVQCAYGGICMVEPEGQAVCRCLADCPAVEAPVCGSDDQTYHNLCTLRLHSCSLRQTVLVQRSGRCGQ